MRVYVVIQNTYSMDHDNDDRNIVAICDDSEMAENMKDAFENSSMKGFFTIETHGMYVSK